MKKIVKIYDKIKIGLAIGFSKAEKITSDSGEQYLICDGLALNIDTNELFRFLATYNFKQGKFEYGIYEY